MVVLNNTDVPLHCTLCQWCQKSLCKNIFLVSSRLCTSPLVCAPPQLTLFTSHTTTSTPRHVCGRQFPTLEIWQSPNKFTERQEKKSMLKFKFIFSTIYEANGIDQYIERCWPANDNDTIITALLQQNKDKILKPTAKNRTKIYLNRSVPNKW